MSVNWPLVFVVLFLVLSWWSIYELVAWFLG